MRLPMCRATLSDVCVGEAEPSAIGFRFDTLLKSFDNRSVVPTDSARLDDRRSCIQTH